ncbi:metallophosphoesterase family protein [Chloroflexota bacterium]
MLIGLVSDTHIPDHARELPEQLAETFKGVDMILHGGDIYAVSVLNDLEKIAPVLAAQGDDETSFTAGDSRVKPKHVLRIDGVTVWLMHEKPKTIDRPVVETDDLPDVVVSGHTHQALIENRDGILYVNPGSPTFPEYKLRPGTVGLLTIEAGKFNAEIIQLK